MVTPRILIIDDDPAFCAGLGGSLRAAGFDVASASTAGEGKRAALSGAPSAIVLDLLLPGVNGADLCRELRRAECAAPILVLSGVTEEIDKVAALEAGADDYMTKPFGVRELVARLRALLRRSRGGDADPHGVAFDGIVVDFRLRAAERHGRALDLSVREFAVLAYFIRHEGEVVSREKLLRDVWGYDALPATRTVDNYVLALRRKLGERRGSPRHLLTVPTAGYRFVRG